MGLFWLLFVLGAFNVCLGYALAVYLGYGLPSLRDAWIALGAESFPGGMSGVGLATPREPPAQAPASLDGLLDTDAAEHLEVEPYDEPYDDDVAELLRPESPEVWDLNEKFVETSILRLNVAMMKSGARATEIDTRLREVLGRADAGTIQRSLDELKTDCELYLAEHSDAAARLHNRINELGELRKLGEQVETANMEQVSQIETTLSNLSHMDFRSDPETAAMRLLTEIGHLRLARHKLRDSQEEAFLVIARYENRLDKIEQRLFTDPLTKLRNRIGLETTLWEWWQAGRHRTKQICAALVDLDGFGKINEQYGSRIGDRVLCRVGQLLLEAAGPADLAARYAGQRFALVLLDSGPRAAIKSVELFRQTLERTTFRHDEIEIRLTVCGAVTEARPDDAYNAVFARLEEPLKQAKQAGPNRSVLADRGAAEPIESPNLGAKYVEIAV